MLNNKTIAVIVPAFNEQNHIHKVITSIPDFVDRIIVINDGSTDSTESIVESLLSTSLNKSALNFNLKIEKDILSNDNFPDYSIKNKSVANDKIILVNHHKNSGKGAGIKTGYQICKTINVDCVATMDGDGQMNPNELIHLCEPVISGKVDYVKGNRLIHHSAWSIIPKLRIFGNIVLTFFTRPCSGYWQVNDTQTGFTVLSGSALQKIAIHEIYSFYGYPNDILVKLNSVDCTVMEVVVTPIYDDNHKSKMKIYKVIPKITYLLIQSFFKRYYNKYWKNQKHPIFIILLSSITFISLGIFILNWYFIIGILILFFGLSAFFCILYWDYLINKSLYIK